MSKKAKTENNTIIRSGRKYTRVDQPMVRLLTRKDGSAVLELREDGTILWEGRKVNKDAELVEALRAVVRGPTLYKPVEDSQSNEPQG